MIRLVVTHEDGQVDSYEFDNSESPVGIGRRSNNAICIPNLSVSGHHARLHIDSASAWIEDLDSTNGTYVNNRLVSRQRLRDGDELILGKVRVAVHATALSSDSESAEASDGKLASAGIAGAAGLAATTDRETDPYDGSSADRHDEEPLSLQQKARMAIDQDHAEAQQAEAPIANPPASDAAPADPFAAAEAEAGLDPLDGLEAGGAMIQIKNGAKSGQTLPIDKPVTTLGRPGIQIAAIMRKPDGYFLMHIESDDGVEPPTLNHDSLGDDPVLLRSGDRLNVAGIEVEFMVAGKATSSAALA